MGKSTAAASTASTNRAKVVRTRSARRKKTHIELSGDAKIAMTESRAQLMEKAIALQAVVQQLRETLRTLEHNIGAGRVLLTDAGEGNKPSAATFLPESTRAEIAANIARWEADKGKLLELWNRESGALRECHARINALGSFLGEEKVSQNVISEGEPSLGVAISAVLRESVHPLTKAELRDRLLDFGVNPHRFDDDGNYFSVVLSRMKAKGKVLHERGRYSYSPSGTDEPDDTHDS